MWQLPNLFQSRSLISLDFLPTLILCTITCKPKLSCTFFLTEFKTKPLDPDNNDTLPPHLKCRDYELFSSFYQNGGVCAFIRSDVQASRPKHYDVSITGFQLSWLKISLPDTSKYTCILYRSPNSINYSIILQNLLNLSCYNLPALKLLSLVISMLTTPTG